MRHLAPIARAIVLWTLLWSVGCDRDDQGDRSSPSPATVTAQEKSPLSAQSKVARIVFIDQEKACECTMNKIQASWTALQAALGPNSSLDVERIHRDTQEEQAEEYRLLRPMVTVPGIYLLDDSGAIVELLQGEVTQEQVRNALAP